MILRVIYQYKSFSLFIISVIFFCNSITAQPFRSFELRYFSDDPAANGETDFKGPVSVFDTEKRVEFLSHYADFSKDFFNDPDFNYEVVSDS